MSITGNKKVEMINTRGKCTLGISEACYKMQNGNAMLTNGICNDCILNQSYVVSKILGEALTKRLRIKSTYYQLGMTFRSKAQRLMEEEQGKERIAQEEQDRRDQEIFDYRDAIEQRRCSNLDYDDITPDDEYHNRIFLEKSWGYGIDD